MKISFTGDSLHEIHQQIITEAEFLKKPKANGKPVSTMTVVDTAQPEVSGWEEYKVPPVVLKDPLANVFEGVDWAKQGADKTTGVNVGPSVTASKQDKIDGYTVSDGKVWMPVEGRSSAFTGVEVDEYHKRKAATGELDAAGTPWNPAIHTSTKAKTNKGIWKNRPGGGAAKVEQPALQSAPEVVEPAKPATVQEVVTHEDSAPPIGRAPSMHNYDSFKANLMTIVVKLINENKITRDYMKDLNAYFQVANLWDVKNDDTKCQQLFRLFIDYQFIMGA